MFPFSFWQSASTEVETFDDIFGQGNYINWNTIDSIITLDGTDVTVVTDEGTYNPINMVQPANGFEPQINVGGFLGQDFIDFGNVGDTYFLRTDTSAPFTDYSFIHNGSKSYTVVSISRLNADNWIWGNAFSSAEHGFITGTDGNNNYRILIANGSGFPINQSINLNTIFYKDWVLHIWGYNVNTGKFYQSISGDKLREYTPGTLSNDDSDRRVEIGRRPGAADYSDLHTVHHFIGLDKGPNEVYDDIVKVTTGDNYWQDNKSALFNRNNLAYFTSDDSVFDLADESATFGGWFYSENSTANDSLMGKYRNGDESYMLWKQGGGPSWRFQMNNGTSGKTLVSSATVTTGWHFLVAVYDATTDTMKLSVDGAAFDTTSHSGGFNPTSNELFGIGGYSGFGQRLGNNFYADQVFFAKGETFTLSEIQDLYNSGAGKKWSDLTDNQKGKMTAYYTMDRFKKGFDETGNEHHLKNNNGVRDFTAKVN